MKRYPNDFQTQLFGCGLLEEFVLDTNDGAIQVAIDGGRQIVESARTKHNITVGAMLESIDAIDEVDRCHINCFANSEDLMK